MTVFNDLSAITGVDSNGNASGSYVVDFTASANPQDYWEYDPAEGTLHDRFPANMFTNDQIYWIERFRVQQSGSFINIHNGTSQVQTSFFESTWTDDWAWYFYSVDSDQYLILQANDQNGVGGSFITYTMSNWTIVAQSTGTQTSTEWLNDLAGERMVVALVPTNTYRPGEAATIKINATETTAVAESLAVVLGLPGGPCGSDRRCRVVGRGSQSPGRAVGCDCCSGVHRIDRGTHSNLGNGPPPSNRWP